MMDLAHQGLRFVAQAPPGTPPLGPINEMLGRAVVVLLALLGAAATAVGVYAAARYMFSFGRTHAIEEAKATLAAGAKGLALGGLATALVGIIRWVVG
jgi:hypothetical protein